MHALLYVVQCSVGCTRACQMTIAAVVQPTVDAGRAKLKGMVLIYVAMYMLG
jgi:Ni,Fe-hydrogenase III small subunit